MNYLHDYHYVLMLDADAYISEPSISIEEKIAEYMTDDFTIVVPKNCMVGESRYQINLGTYFYYSTKST